MFGNNSGAICIFGIRQYLYLGFKIYISVLKGTPVTDSVVNRLVRCDNASAMTTAIHGHKYIIPPKCAFLMSDITRMQPLVTGLFIDCLPLLIIELKPFVYYMYLQCYTRIMQKKNTMVSGESYHPRRRGGF